MDIKIGKLQFFVLVTMFTSGGSILILPSIAAAEARQNAWISIILSLLLGLAIIFIYVSLNAKFPDKSFVQYSEIILGKIAGKTVAVLFLFSTFLLSATLLWDISNLINIQIMSDTPILAILVLMLIVVVMGARMGLETIARTGEILFPWAVILFLIPTVFLFTEVEWENLLPILEEGFKPVVRSSYTVTAIMFVESYVLLMIIPYVSEKKAIFKTFTLGILLAGIALWITVVYCIAVLGAKTTGQLVFPTYTLAKMVSVGRFVERIEAIVAGIWVITIYFKATVCLFATVLGTAQLFNIRNYQPLTLPFGFVLLALASIIFPNMTFFRIVAGKYFPMLDYTVGFFIPLLLLIVYTLRKNSLQNETIPQTKRRESKRS